MVTRFVWPFRFALLITALLIGCPLLQAADENLVDLAKVLDASKNSRLDLEMKTGKAYVRATIVKVTVNSDKEPKELRILDPDTNRQISIGFSAVRSITIDREKVYEAAATSAKPATGKAALADKAAKAAAAEREQLLERLAARGIKPWPELSREEHEAVLAKQREQIAGYQKTFPGLAVYETHEFLFVSNMPKEQVAPYATSLDKMYDMMCQMYRIKRGTPVFKGKCLVVAFVDKVDFERFEQEFMSNNVQDGVMGLCHQSSSGDVLISCYRGNDPLYFGQLLVHETSHGFIHRYRSASRLPSWANEGMAEWIAMALVPYQGGVARKQESARSILRSSRTMQGLLEAEKVDGGLQHYGMSSLLTDFLIRADKVKYANFVDGMKEGKKWEESLKDTYGATREQLIANFGQSIGVADLRP